MKRGIETSRSGGVGPQGLRGLASACESIIECSSLQQLKQQSARVMGEMLRADCVVLGLVNQHTNRPEADTIVTWHVEGGFLEQYLGYYCSFDPCLSFHGESGDPAYGLASVMADRTPEAQEFLFDFLRPQGIARGTLLWSHRGPHDLAITGLWRGQDVAEFSETELAAGKVLASVLAAGLECFAAELPGACHAGDGTAPVCYELTTREEDVAALVCRGLSNKKVGMCLRMSVNTVETHLKSIYRKCGVGSRTALAHRLTYGGGPNARKA